ncbi:energy-coupling factor transporter transmembrane component T family protein [Exiguobacterium aestuarii]|uniref:Energy-coupling factor transporter transmembrane component T family protein n=1 Tax=Exiguobacterium aestuarii TaxID=273527 RepID=A0ABW2PK13_9BACL|nr:MULTISPECIES: energy-coupling factor transporter transmembrane component T [Exiguobacterium]MCT4786704.1 energy-coupling factor transporter transmembrane protein EcfT [Exiguobacterium aestuarii]
MSLHDMNPTVKFLTLTFVMFGLALFYNPWTQLVIVVGTVLIQWMATNVSWKRWLLFLIPFLITALGTFWTTLVFGKDLGGETLVTILSQEVTIEERDVAIALSLRVLAFTVLSLLFMLTTDSKRFVMSLMQQAKLSPTIAYSALVGFRFIPLLKRELQQLQYAHRLRGVPLDTRWERLRHVPKLLLPLLAGSIRRAERVAFSMEARGFTGGKRTIYDRVEVKSSDFIWSGVFFALFGFAIWAGI